MQHQTLSVFSLNANDLRNKITELSSLTCTYDPDILCVTETFGAPSYSNITFNIPGYNIFRQDRTVSSGGGIIIYVRETLSCQVISSIAHDSGCWEAMTCNILSQNSVQLRIVCVYRKPGNMSPLSLDDFIEYFGHATTYNNSFHTLVVGDFNFPKVDWDLNLCNDAVDSPAQRFLSIMMDNHLTQLVSFPTRFRQGQNPSLLDLVLVHDELLVESLDSLPGVGKSDHIILSVTICVPTSRKFNPNTKYNFNLADFDLINSIIESIDWHAEFQNLSCDDALDVLQCFLLTICQNFVPKLKPRTASPKHAVWMHKDIKKLINKKKRMWDTYKANPSASNFLKFKNIRNSLTATIRQKKSDYERDLIAGCRTAPKRFYSYINSKKKTQPLTCLKTKQNVITDDELIAEELGSFFQSVFNASLANENNSYQPFCDEDFTPFFSADDVCKKLCELNPNSSPGPDGIHPKLLKNCASSLATPLFLIFCTSLRTGTFPSAWKDANITPLHKGGCHTSVENYRPISLLSSIAKVFEKIVASFLTNHLLDNNIIHKSQHGFVKGKSCLTNLICAVNDWTLAVDQRLSCDVV